MSEGAAKPPESKDKKEKKGSEYKHTLHLPVESFPMKAGLAQLEPKMLEQWEKQDLFEKIVAHREGAPKFVFHDGPPYANGHLHAGHALNKVLKDMVVKFQNLAGKQCDYVPGWDCHGLPIELAVEKRLREQKIDRRTLSRDDFLERCRAYANEFIDVQRKEFKRMGVLGRWEDPYATLTFDYEAQEIRELAKFAAQDVLYRKKKPVYWCVTDRTALAEAEVEYEDHSSPSVYVAFPASSDLSAKWSALKGKQVAFVIWTTTPWTLAANLAIAVHPKVEYVFYDLGARVAVVAKDLLLPFLAACAPDQLKSQTVKAGPGSFDTTSLVSPEKILAYASGEDLQGLKYKHVFMPRESPVLCAEHVTLEQGTGLVHTAPGHGQEDYELGLAAGLDVYNPVKDDGSYDDTVAERLRGQKVPAVNPLVVDWLAELGVLLNPKTDTVKHSYPHCWRCHNPIIFRATHQWFISLDKTGLRQKSLDQIDHHVNWVPKWGSSRIRGMLETRPDWCISRQRTWGVPIPIALCTSCNEAHVDAAMMNRVADRVEKEGAGVWYRTEVSEFLAPGTQCKGCGKSEFRRETDILDVWFDSACSFAVLEKQWHEPVPVDLYLEGSDQHRGWFHSALLVGVGTRGIAPYKTCLTHGFVVDGKGQKMSKSLGNTVGPDEIIKEFGAEVMRLWVASSDYRDDVRLSKEILKKLAEGYGLIRNKLKYAIGNIADFDPVKNAVPVEKLEPLDRWALSKLEALISKLHQAYSTYEFHLVYHQSVDFLAGDLSAIYFDVLKDVLYTAKTDAPKRRSAQTVLWRIAHDLTVALSPLISFTADEAWSYLPGQKTESVFLADFPKVSAAALPDSVALYDRLMEVRAKLLPLLEAARRDKLIGRSEQAKLRLELTGPAEFAKAHATTLADLLKVSQVELGTPAKGMPAGEGVVAEVVQADGQECPRCRFYRVEVAPPQQPICNRCTADIS
ncbi:MAG: isoleucine--tRNA ligase [Myxococcaceae bacterium]